MADIRDSGKRVTQPYDQFSHAFTGLAQMFISQFTYKPIKALFTGREGYPSKRVNPSWSAKDSPGLQAKFHRQGNPTTRDNLMRGYTQRVWKQQKDNPGRHVNPTWSVYKRKG